MTDDRENVQRLARKLRENLMKCADNADVDPVHDTRTGTRRLQATLENRVRQLLEGDAEQPLRDAAIATMKLLKKIRHEAGPVRDLDVHRKLLEKLTKRTARAGGEEGGGTQQPKEAKLALGEPDLLHAPEMQLRTTIFEKQADDLDAWLKHRRSELTDGLKAQAKDLAAKLDKRVDELQAAFETRRVRRVRKKPPGVVALDSFARLASEIQVLDVVNLHDFRKGAKRARYVAELAAQGDAQARLVGETLKKLQDEIGDWHDWMVLAEEAHAALGDKATELTALLEAEREQHFV